MSDGNEVTLMAIKMARCDGADPDMWREYETSAAMALSALHVMSDVERDVIWDSLPDSRNKIPIPPTGSDSRCAECDCDDGDCNWIVTPSDS